MSAASSDDWRTRIGETARDASVRFNLVPNENRLSPLVQPVRPQDTAIAAPAEEAVAKQARKYKKGDKVHCSWRSSDGGIKTHALLVYNNVSQPFVQRFTVLITDDTKRENAMMRLKINRIPYDVYMDKKKTYIQVGFKHFLSILNSPILMPDELCSAIKETLLTEHHLNFNDYRQNNPASLGR